MELTKDQLANLKIALQKLKSSRRKVDEALSVHMENVKKLQTCMGTQVQDEQKLVDQALLLFGTEFLKQDL